MTIYALSTGPGISGIAIIRVSGKNTKKVIKLLTNVTAPEPIVATLRKINKCTKKGLQITRHTLENKCDKERMIY